jgi:hypothetical protein
MLTVDPIIVFDPLDGAENNNVARSCFAWSSIRWVFDQSYMTVGRRLLQRMRNLAIDSPVHQRVSMVDLDAGTRLWTPLYWSFSFHSKHRNI